MDAVDYSADNIVEPVITATVELPPREPVREHKKIRERYARRRHQDEDDNDEQVNVNHIGAGPQQLQQIALPFIEPVRATAEDTSPGILWRVVSKLQWRNRSDGPAPNNAAAGLVRGLTAAEKVVFVRDYNENLGATVVALTNIFAVRDITQPANKLAIASHVIALGREQYRSFMEDISLFEFLIDCDEIQSFDTAIRPHL